VVLFLQRVFDALANGAVYAALAVALSIVYRSSGMLNFALGELAMASTFLALLLTSRPSPLVRGSTWFAQHLGTPWSVWVTIPAVMALSVVVGAAVERVLG
jgi:branched-chain amino acid transport system permease protein